MSPEDRLDALLSASGRVGGMQTPLSEEEAALAPLLAAAARVRVLAGEAPRPAFARDLEQRLLARAGVSADEQTTTSGSAASGSTLPAAMPTPLVRTGGGPRARRWWRRRLVQAVAAAAVLVIGAGGVFTAGAMAAPGSPFFGLHRWEQGVRAALDTSAAGRARLHLQYLTDALTALDAAVARNNGSGAYRDALATVRDEDGAAAREIASVAPGEERDALAARLAALRDRERASLRGALGTPLEWPSRLLTTQALGGLGEQVPTIDDVSFERADTGDGRTWRIVLTGAGYQPGAVFVLRGRPIGAIQTLTATQMVILWSGDDRSFPDGALGILNPDGSAAATGAIQPGVDDGQGGSSTPGVASTPGKGDGGHGDRGGKGATPTPSPTPTGKPTPTDIP